MSFFTTGFWAGLGWHVANFFLALGFYVVVILIIFSVAVVIEIKERRKKKGGDVQ